jgi:hypothetical protein
MPDISTITMPYPTVHHAQIRHGALRPPCLRRGSQVVFRFIFKIIMEKLIKYVLKLIYYDK